MKASLTNGRDIKSLWFEVRDRTLYFQKEVGYDKLTLSYLGFNDTVLDLKKISIPAKLKLSRKVIELSEVSISGYKPVNFVDKIDKKENIIWFNFSSKSMYLFDVDLTQIEAKQLYKMGIQLKNTNSKDSLVVYFYYNYNYAVNNQPIWVDTISLNNIGKKRIIVFDYDKNGIVIDDNCVVGFQLIQNNKNKSTKPTSILTLLQDNPTQIYLKDNLSGIINKSPMESHYFKNFKAYPKLFTTLVVGK